MESVIRGESDELYLYSMSDKLITYFTTAGLTADLLKEVDAQLGEYKYLVFTEELKDTSGISDIYVDALVDNIVRKYTIGDEQGNLVSDFNGQEISLQMDVDNSKYTHEDGSFISDDIEFSEIIKAYYVKDSDTLELIDNSTYDEKGMCWLGTNHFSEFVVAEVALVEAAQSGTTDDAISDAVDNNPETGDDTNLILSFASLTLLAFALVFIARKRKEELN